ncbi:Mu phage endolysin Lys [Synergistales bacterium]|nr:Mu phage endolysin Lys [Synergistales bacterium]
MIDYFAECMNFILKCEGGYVNDPLDKGGETNMGITAATLKRARDAGLSVPERVKDLSQMGALLIYRQFYWEPYVFKTSPWPACLALLDATVNHGPGGMAAIAQRTGNSLGWKLDVDGKYGPNTARSIEKMTAAQPVEYTTEFLRQRKIYYDRIIAKNQSQRRFENGWYRRVRDLASMAGVKSPV